MNPICEFHRTSRGDQEKLTVLKMVKFVKVFLRARFQFSFPFIYIAALHNLLAFSLFNSDAQNCKKLLEYPNRSVWLRFNIINSTVESVICRSSDVDIDVI